MEKRKLRIKELRRNRKLTQSQLGEVVGVSGQTILNWENSLYEPSINSLCTLSKYFGVSVDYIIGNKPSTNLVSEISAELRKISYEELVSIISKTLKEISDKTKK